MRQSTPVPFDSPKAKLGRQVGNNPQEQRKYLPTADSLGKNITYKEYYLPKSTGDTTNWGAKRLIAPSIAEKPRAMKHSQPQDVAGVAVALPPIFFGISRGESTTVIPTIESPKISAGKAFGLVN